MFDAYSKLPPPVVPTSLQVMKFAGAYVNIETEDNQEKRWFDWRKFKAAVDGYNGDDLTFDKYKSTTIASSQSTVDSMVNRIVQFLKDALSVVLSATDITALKATLEATFTNLKQKSSNGFLDFSKSSHGHNSSWEYRIQFAFPNPDLPEYFYSLVTTIKLEADVTSESEWWGLSSSSSKNFSASINAIELVVRKGFRNPN